MKRLEGKRIAILVANEFEDIEVQYTVVRLSEEGASITVGTLPAGATDFCTRPYVPGNIITGRFGTTVPFLVLEEGLLWNHKIISEMKAADYDAVMVPGGFAPDFLRQNDETLTFVAEMYKAGKVVSAICHGPQLLISVDAVKGTDIIRGKRVCSFIAIRDDMRNAGGLWEDTPAVTDGRTVTGRICDDLTEFCHQLTEAIATNV